MAKRKRAGNNLGMSKGGSQNVSRGRYKSRRTVSRPQAYKKDRFFN